jgi:ribonuclease/clavin/mitogillin
MRVLDAVTAVLVCDGEIYLTRRQPHLTAFPGFQAFPGGKVDARDGEQPLDHPLLAGHEPRLIEGLARELREELDYDLAAALADGEVLAFGMLGTAISPPIISVRFDTRFYRIDLRQKPAFRLDPGELSDGAWSTAAQWMGRYDHGDLLLAPPTRDVLLTLAAHPDSHRVSRLGDYDAFTGTPEIEPLRGVFQLPIPSNTLPPADRTNAFIIGDTGAARLIVDPSPATRHDHDQLCAHLTGRGISEVFLTHHHPDHRQYANELARDLGVPIAMSADTRDRILARQPRWLDGLTVRIREDGDVVTRWLGHPVRGVAVPGHDEGQLALMPDNRAWCIVGDLIQGVGTVVISAPEGDMAKYFATLEKVIALAPKVIWPSHGSALGGTFYLEQTLKHRRLREAQVKTLSGAGKSVDEMLATMYPDIDPRLLPLARMNIDSHLVKLRAEGALPA